MKAPPNLVLICLSSLERYRLLCSIYRVVYGMIHTSNRSHELLRVLVGMFSHCLAGPILDKRQAILDGWANCVRIPRMFIIISSTGVSIQHLHLLQRPQAVNRWTAGGNHNPLFLELPFRDSLSVSGTNEAPESIKWHENSVPVRVLWWRLPDYYQRSCRVTNLSSSAGRYNHRHRVQVPPTAPLTSNLIYSWRRF